VEACSRYNEYTLAGEYNKPVDPDGTRHDKQKRRCYQRRS
jgi:hypothetical protein